MTADTCGYLILDNALRQIHDHVWVSHLKQSWSSPSGQNGCHFANDIVRCIFVNEKCILIKISLTFVPKCPIYNNPALVQIMFWRRIGDKPLFEPMLTRFLDAYMWHYGDDLSYRKLHEPIRKVRGLPRTVIYYRYHWDSVSPMVSPSTRSDVMFEYRHTKTVKYVAWLNKLIRHPSHLEKPLTMPTVR